MAGAEDDAAGKAAEITEMVRQLREQVRAHHPEGAAGETGVRVADLMPLVHARDDAQAKVAAIGSVNPRPAGVLNSLVQTLKRWLARALDWHVREQVEFNRAVVDALNSAIEALNETNRALAETATLHYEQRRSFGEQLSKLRADLDEARDIRTHWQEWRQGWEQKLATNEIQFLRSVADLQASFQHRVTQIESNFRDLVRSQHDDFTMALEKSGLDIQKRLWRDMGRIREEYERLIHNELHLLDRMIVRLTLAGLSDDGSRMVLRNDFLRDGRLVARVTSTAGWLDLSRRKLTCPPEPLLQALQGISRSEDFAALPSSVSQASAGQ